MNSKAAPPAHSWRRGKTARKLPFARAVYPKNGSYPKLGS